AEYCLGSGANEAGGLPVIGTGIEENEGQRYLAITFRKRLGRAGGLHYLIEDSEDLDNWTPLELAATEIRRVNPHDGTGTVIVTCRAPAPLTERIPTRCLRVRVAVGP
nr:hypothetical protein [Akkermansiaceae bacterium]